MRAHLRSIFIVLLAAAFVVGGAGKASFAQLEHAPPAHKGSAHDHHAHQHGVAHAHHQEAPHDKDQQSASKCCSLCIAVSTEIPGVPGLATALSASRISYSLISNSTAGRFSFLDPGIPKPRA